MTIADVLAPVTVDEFLRTYVGRQFLLIRGQRGRFSTLVSWSDLDGALSRLRVHDGRVAMVKKAKQIPAQSYVYTSRSNGSQYLNGPSVTAHALDGATLVVNQVDELFSEVRRLTESCEQLFQIYTQANLYAGWRSDNGFDVHWDRHDTLVLQILGRKNWKVWTSTRPHPLPGDEKIVTPPTSDPIWQGTLEDGDVLYMPRGWWHVAFPRDEPSLHVTVGLMHPTGLDLLNWVTSQLRELAEVRLDVPHWKSAADRREWLSTLRKACADALGDDAVDRFMWSLNDTAHTRPIINLPQQAMLTPVRIVNDTPLRLVRGRRLHIDGEVDSDTISFVAQGRVWSCDIAVAPALALLNHVTPCTLADMYRVVQHEQRQVLVRPIIEALVEARAVWVEARPAESSVACAETGA